MRAIVSTRAIISVRALLVSDHKPLNTDYGGRSGETLNPPQLSTLIAPDLEPSAPHLKPPFQRHDLQEGGRAVLVEPRGREGESPAKSAGG